MRDVFRIREYRNIRKIVWHYEYPDTRELAGGRRRRCIRFAARPLEQLQVCGRDFEISIYLVSDFRLYFMERPLSVRAMNAVIFNRNAFVCKKDTRDNNGYLSPFFRLILAIRRP